MALAADGQDGNGLKFEKFRLKFSSSFCASQRLNVASPDQVEISSNSYLVERSFCPIPFTASL